MARTQRKKSITGIYHVVFRGINRQQIFEDDEDYKRFLSVLKRYQKTCGYQLYAYCLMPNHIHLLIKEGTENLGLTFKRIGGSFVYWYNLKYDRVGHLFQDRYRSEAVENDAYLLTVLRYIHRNPVKAGLCREPEDYVYSSMAGYETNSLIDSSFIFGIIDRDEFFRFQHICNEDICLDIAERGKPRLSDQEAKQMMKRLYHCDNLSEFQASEKETQETILRMLRTSGGSLRQVNRLTGVPIGQIRKI